MITLREPVRFSVVTPLYNKRDHVARAIRSVLGQSDGAFELIIVDDGSTDQGAEIVRSFGRQVTLIRQQNRGEAAARNSGIRTATGSHIAFLDADDSWEPNFLATIKCLIAEHPKAAIYGTGYKIVGADGLGEFSSAERFSDSTGRLDYFAALAEWVFPLTSSTVCVPTGKFNEVGLFDERLMLATDVDLWIRLTLSGSAAYSPNVCATYHKDASNRSTEQKEFWDKRLRFVDVLHDRLGDPGISAHDRRNLMKFLAKATYEALVAKSDADPAIDLRREMKNWRHILNARYFSRASMRRIKLALVHFSRGLSVGARC